MGREHNELKAGIKEAVKKAVSTCTKPDEMADYVARYAMENIYENFRSISEVHSIVDAVRCGMRVQVDYYDEELDDDECSVRQAW